MPAQRIRDLFRGMGYALLADLVFVGLVWLVGGGALMWAPAIVWAMGALAVTGFAIAEGRYLTAGGFWLLQIGLFTLFLAGFMKFLQILAQTPTP